MSRKKKNITQEYITNLLDKITQGEKPQKERVFLSKKAFLQTMRPHIIAFTNENYTPREIAAFLGHVSENEIQEILQKEAEKSTDTAKKSPHAAASVHQMDDIAPIVLPKTKPVVKIASMQKSKKTITSLKK